MNANIIDMYKNNFLLFFNEKEGINISEKDQLFEKIYTFSK